MPALITHDFFGRDVYDRLYTFIGGSRDEADAFLLGNQGPDCFTWCSVRSCARTTDWARLCTIKSPASF